MESAAVIRSRARNERMVDPMKRLSLILLGGVTSVLLAAHPLAAAPVGKPNIVVIVSDDQGYNDLGVQGSRDIPTPSIDALARGGVRFTSGYVSGPYCSPTRAGLMTGRYQQRYGHEFNLGPPSTATLELGLPLTETTLPQRLQQAGYATGLVGKWHLGHAPKFHPMRRGFDEFYGFLGGLHSYADARADAANPILRGRQVVDEKEYLTDAIGREAVAYIEQHQRSPFFLYVAFNAVHVPMQAPPKYRDRFASIEDERRRMYAAMTSALDDNVGRILAKLREAGLEKNTLVFYLSDNGGDRGNASNNSPLRGRKAQTLEGGIRVPYFLKWPARLRAGRTYDQPVIQLDIAATALAAAGVKLAADARLDGVDLLPYLTGQKSEPPHDVLYWRLGPQMAIRQGDWKLVRYTGSRETELYNLADDIGERNNLAQSWPERRRELQDQWEAWNAQLATPRWPAPSRRVLTSNEE
jgi:arylsulfatase A-like enzyme